MPHPKKYNLKIFLAVEFKLCIKWTILMKNVTQINCFRNIFQTLPGIWWYFCHCVNRMITVDWFLNFQLCLYWQKSFLYLKNIGEQSNSTITGRSKKYVPRISESRKWSEEQRPSRQNCGSTWGILIFLM